MEVPRYSQSTMETPSENILRSGKITMVYQFDTDEETSVTTHTIDYTNTIDFIDPSSMERIKDLITLCILYKLKKETIHYCDNHNHGVLEIILRDDEFDFNTKINHSSFIGKRKLNEINNFIEDKLHKILDIASFHDL